MSHEYNTVTLPKGYETKKQKVSNIIKQIPIDEDIVFPLIGYLFFADLALFIILLFVPAEQNVKLFIIAIYFISSITILYFIFVWHFKKHELNKLDIVTLENLISHGFVRRLVHIIPVIFIIIMINFVFFSIYGESLTDAMNSLSPDLTGFVTKLSETFPGLTDPSNKVPGPNAPTILLFFLVLVGQIGYAASLPFYIASEIKFYKAQEYFQNAKNEISVETISVMSVNTTSVKKINLFIKGLDSYDKYLRKRFKNKIDRNKIFSELMANSKLHTDKIIEELSQAFQNSDKLYPLKIMSELSDNKRAGELLVRISRFDTFKESIDGVFSGISVVIAIVSVFILHH